MNRPCALARLALALLCVLAPAFAPALAASPLVLAVDAVGMTVSDMDRSVHFFSDVLSFEKTSDVEVHGLDFERLAGVFGLRMRVVRLKLGEETLELTQYLAPEGRPMPADSRGNDRWFQHVAIIVRDMDEAYRHLRERGVRHASSGPQRLPDWNPNASGIDAFYFKDPDGHFLEVLAFPAGKGDPRWQSNERLFLGIDHTAIVVADTGRSLGFYRDHLGLEVRGESENYGTEQEHLNNVFGARLRITALGAAKGPGIELLEYLAPRDGREYPRDARPNDLLHWQTTLVARDLDRAAAGTAAAGFQWVSPGPTELRREALGFERGLLVRDADGHAMRLVAP